MSSSELKRTSFYVLLLCGFLAIDIVIDVTFGDGLSTSVVHIVFAIAAISIMTFLLNRALAAHRQAETVLRLARDELESRVQERTSELEHANERLKIEIGERQVIERALRDSEEKYRVTFENFPEPAFVWDRNGGLLMQNLAAAQSLSRRRNDFNDQTIVDLFGEDGRNYLVALQRVIDTGVTERLESSLELPIGRRYFSTSIHRLQEPNGQYVAQSMSSDITERKRAEAALRSSEEKFATVFHASPDAIAIVRWEDNVLLDVNQAFARLVGFARDDIIGKMWVVLSLKEGAAWLAEVDALFQERRQVSEYEISYTLRDGAQATVLLSLLPIWINDEVCRLAIIHDISQRKRSEDALHQAQAELAEGIRSRAALEERQRLARELHDSVSQALYGISLGANTALAQSKAGRRDETIDALNYVLALAQAGVAEMRALLFELRSESLEMEGLVSALGKQAQALQARYSIPIETDLSEEPEAPLAVKEALYRIALEALQNALKHARPERLELHLCSNATGVWLDVCDDGIGFDPQANYPGHLGLCSMHERAANIGGILEIVSAAGCGTQIHLQIPSQTLELAGVAEAAHQSR